MVTSNEFNCFKNQANTRLSAEARYLLSFEGGNELIRIQDPKLIV